MNLFVKLKVKNKKINMAKPKVIKRHISHRQPLFLKSNVSLVRVPNSKPKAMAGNETGVVNSEECHQFFKIYMPDHCSTQLVRKYHLSFSLFL